MPSEKEGRFDSMKKKKGKAVSQAHIRVKKKRKSVAPLDLTPKKKKLSEKGGMKGRATIPRLGEKRDCEKWWRLRRRHYRIRPRKGRFQEKKKRELGISRMPQGRKEGNLQ